MKTPMTRGSALLATFLLGVWLASSCRADLSEDQAKTSLIYNLTKFVQWPQSPADKMLNVCVYREDTIFSTLLTLRDKTSKGLGLRIQRVDTTDESRGCHVLFIGRGEQTNLRLLSRALHGLDTLVVSDIPDGAAIGAMVEIFLDNRRIAFKVNKGAADEANLKLSSQLLSLAKVVYDSK